MASSLPRDMDWDAEVPRPPRWPEHGAVQQETGSGLSDARRPGARAPLSGGWGGGEVRPAWPGGLVEQQGGAASGRGSQLAAGGRPPPPLVLSGHAASLTSY